MNTALWVVQGLLSLMFIMAGIMKSIQPGEKLKNLSWTTRYSPNMIKFIGVSELLIGLGLILPELTGIIPILTPIAAIALCLVMIFAAIDHYKFREMKEIGINLFIFIMSAFVAYGRFRLFLSFRIEG